MTTAHAIHPSIRRRSDCRLCGSSSLQMVFSLGSTPPANEFVTCEARGKAQDVFPLDVFFCSGCAHVQLLDIVDPARLFRDYVYVSSTSPVFVEHFRRYAEAMIDLAGLRPGSVVIEIGSNDGVLLRFFKAAGMKVLGIDPAVRIAEEATKTGIETMPEFFDRALVDRLERDGIRASLIAANNVFAHADDLHTIVDGVERLLEPDGVFVFEVSYLVDVVEKTLFDTIYHEHVSYHSVKPLVGLFERHGMELVDALRVDSHGGSLRGIAQKRGGKLPPTPRVRELISLEQARGLHGPEAFAEFFATIQERKRELTQLLTRLKREGGRIAGFGAPAKATTLMYHFGLGADVLDYIIDDSPLKQGLFTPGLHVPVVPSSHLYDAATRPDHVLLLAWNFADPIMKKHTAFRESGGTFIVPLPRLEVFR